MSDAERQRISATAHAGSLIRGPIGEETVAGLITLIQRHGVDASSRVLDLGRGPAELLRRSGDACAVDRAEAGWADYETLPELLDFVMVLATR